MPEKEIFDEIEAIEKDIEKARLNIESLWSNLTDLKTA
jgi:regulator of replication initiation timing